MVMIHGQRIPARARWSNAFGEVQCPAPNTKRKHMYVKQAANTLEILEYFARRLRPATPAELADDLEWPRSSTLNLVGTLVSKGFLHELGGRAGYYPSPR